MLLPRALAIRKTTLTSIDASAASGQPARQVYAAQPIPPSPQSPCQRSRVSDQTGTPVESHEFAEGQRPAAAVTQVVCNEHPEVLPERGPENSPIKGWNSQLSNGADQLARHGRDPPPHFESKITHPSSTNYPVGCIVWLTGLPEASLTKPHILQLIDAISEPSFTTEFMSTQKIVQDSGVSSASGKVKYVDFIKGLTNCHLRFCSPLWASQLVRVIQVLSGPDKTPPVVLLIEGITIDCRRLEANLIDGRREEIYWEKIPKHLHNR